MNPESLDKLIEFASHNGKVHGILLYLQKLRELDSLTPKLVTHAMDLIEELSKKKEPPPKN